MLPGLLDPFWAGLLAKMLATAAIAVAVSALVERVGPFLGAMIATLRRHDRHPADLSWARLGLRGHGSRSSLSGGQRAHGPARVRRHRGLRGCVRSTGPALSHLDQRRWGAGSLASHHNLDYARTVEHWRRAGPA